MSTHSFALNLGISESEHRDILDELSRADRAIQRRGHRHTLSPDRSQATPLSSLGHTILCDRRLPSQPRVRLVRGLIEIDAATHDNFPDNVFWDLDALIGASVRQIVDRPNEPKFVERLVKRIVELQSLFGQHSNIRFRYAHDFLYGFDWARWVKKAPEERRDHGPFDIEFLDALQARGGELVKLIESGDAKYPPLTDANARNPFPFSRDVEEERRLHCELAKAACIPVRAWETTPALDWQTDYGARRRERAAALGINKT